MKKRMGLFAVVVTIVMAVGGCKKEEAAKSEPAPGQEKEETKAVPAPSAQTPKPESPEFVSAVMKPYEECRALLAADKSEGVADCAKAVSDAAKAAAATAPEDAKEALASIVTAAEALASAGVDDLEKVRMLYGDVSKSVVGLLTAIPEAAKHYHVFECPMAKGYQRWAQVDSKLANPYMGSKMLECGSEVHDHHKGSAGDHGMDKAHDGHDTDDGHHHMHDDHETDDGHHDTH